MLIPMVSFCDIPLSQVKEHIGKYGSYGIGLTKDWAMTNRLSPVHYVATGSQQALALKTLNNEMIAGNQRTWGELTAVQRASFYLIAFNKNYEGDLVRSGKTSKNYRFYDEREWRYIPECNDRFPVITTCSATNTRSQKASLNRLVSGLRLTFTPSDIKYIIVKTEKEISDFVDVIRTAKGKSYSLSETERLTTRIITKEQIDSDL